MKNFSELKAALSKGTTPAQKAGTFVSGVLDIVSANRSNPQAIDQCVSEGREYQDSLIHELTT